MARKLGDTIPASLAGKAIKKHINFTQNTLAKLPKAKPGKRYYVFDKVLPKLRCYVTDRGHKSLCIMLTVEGKTVRFSANPAGYSDINSVDIEQARSYAASLMQMSQAQLKNLRSQAETRGQRKPAARRVSRFATENMQSVFTIPDDDKRSLTTEELMQMYLYSKGSKLSKKSVETYRDVIPRHFPDHYELPFYEILNRNLMLDALHAAKGAMSAIRHINMLYNWAKNNLLDNNFNPIFDEPNPAENLMKTTLKDMAYEPRTNSLQPSETVKWFNIVESLNDDRDTDFLLFIFLTGMRAGDTASNLRWKNLDFNKNKFSMLTKGKHAEKSFPLPSYVARRLQQRAKQAGSDDLVFPQANRGQRAKLIRLVEQGMGRKITNHDLRRTFSQIAAANGIEKTTIKQLMNHETDSDVTSKHYINNDAAVEAWREAEYIDPLQSASETIVSIILKHARRHKTSAKVVAIGGK